MQVRIGMAGIASAFAVSAACVFDAGGAAAASWAASPGAVSGTASRLVQPVKSCRRVPIWGWRISAFCKPTGICNDRVIKGYKTVCS